MARKRASSSLKDKVNKNAKKHADDPIQMGRVDLPPGIRNGKATLTKCYFGKSDNGEFWRAEGSVYHPQSHEGMKIKGLTTTRYQSLGVEDFDKAVAFITNELKKLGATAEDIGERDLEEIMEELVEAEVQFVFSTTPRYAREDLEIEKDENGKPKKGAKLKPKKGAKPTGAWENWNGAIEDEEIENEDDEEDDTEDEEDVDDDDPDDEEDDFEDEEEDDLDEDDEEEVDDEDNEDEEEPEKGDKFLYKPPRKRKPIQCEVTLVNKSKETVNLKDEDGKIYKAVGWDDLQLDDD